MRRRAVGLKCSSVGDVHLLVVRAEAEAVALREAVGYAPDLAGGGFQAVDLTWKHWGGTEGLFPAVCWTVKEESQNIRGMEGSDR